MHSQLRRTDNLFVLATNKVIPLTTSPLTSCCIDYATTATDWEYIRNKIGSVHKTYYWGVFVCPLLPWKSSKYDIFWVCVCSLSYPACNEQVSHYAVTCVLSGCTKLFCISTYMARFSEKKVTEHKTDVLIFLQLLSETFHILQRIQCGSIINVPTTLHKVPVIIVRF